MANFNDTNEKEPVVGAAVAGTLAEESFEPPPNGGFTAWSQVFASFWAFFNCWGILAAFGTYQAYYKETLLASTSPSAISWVGSVQGFLTGLSTAVFGRLMDAGYLRSLMVGGTVLLSFGMMMTSLSTELYQIFLAQGICVGLGCSAIFAGSVTVVAQYFTTKRSVAMGIVAVGSSLGGVVWPIAISNLNATVGFGWSCRIVGFMSLATCSVPCLLLKARVPPRKSGSIVDKASLLDLPYMLWAFALLLGFMGIYVPQFYLESYASSIGVRSELIFYLLPILNAVSTVGRIIPPYLADRVGSLNVLIPFTLACGVLSFCWMSCTTTGSLIAFTALYGLCSGTFLSMPPACFASLTPARDIHKLGTRIGMGFALGSLGILSGNPIAGALVRAEGGYVHAQIFSGTLMLASSCLSILAKLAANRKISGKV